MELLKKLSYWPLVTSPEMRAHYKRKHGRELDTKDSLHKCAKKAIEYGISHLRKTNPAELERLAALKPRVQGTVKDKEKVQQLEEEMARLREMHEKAIQALQKKLEETAEKLDAKTADCEAAECKARQVLAHTQIIRE